ncbi:Rv3235 family protein [Mycobacterium sp. CSUR Q5927]|nr:Rv3235 family protein [Mycobacterium sp. CSUR Q5927]
MTLNPNPPVRSSVAPVIDYEPPARAAVPCRPVPPVSAPSSRPRRGQPPGLWPHRPARGGLAGPLQSAAVFADAALRRVLEAIDGRRPTAHLHPLLAAGLAESVLAARPVDRARGGPATLQRVRVQQVGSGGSASLDEGEAKLGPPHEHGGSASLDEGEAKLGPPHEPAEPTTAVEAFGTYRRGRRTHALACRIERVAGPGAVMAWQIVALHIG